MIPSLDLFIFTPINCRELNMQFMILEHYQEDRNAENFNGCEYDRFHLIGRTVMSTIVQK